MATGRAAELLRKPGQPRQATFLELFFDLVFIFALTRISSQLVEDLAPNGGPAERLVTVSEALETLLLLLALWVVWLATVVITDLYDPQRPDIQLLVVATMFSTLLMAVAVPDAFSKRGIVFAGAYVAIHIGRGLFFVSALRGHPAQRRAVQVLFWFAISAVPWLAGAVVTGPARGLLWTLALAVDYTGLALRWPTPKLGRAGTAGLPVVAEHLAERYRQFFIIALGELILAIGLTYSGSGFEANRSVALVVAFATTVLLWRVYIYRAGELLHAAIEAARDPGRLAQLTSVAHLVMVTGIVGISAGHELVIEHPFGHKEPAWIAVILGGPALFLAGRAIFEYAVFARVSWNRAVGVLALAVVSPAMILLPLLAAAIAAALVLAGIAVSDAARARGRPPEQPSPRQ